MPPSSDACERAGLGVDMPCPFVRCRHHLSIEVSRTGGLQEIFPHWRDDVGDDEPTCSLAEARKGAMSSTRVGEMLALGSNRVDQIERIAVEKLAKTLQLDVRDVMVALKTLGS
jgi:hypothetical protein